MKKINLIILIIVLIFLSLALSFFYWLNYVKPVGIEAPVGETDLCAEFSGIEDTVSCEDARTVVLEKYPGEIKYIKRTKGDLPVGLLPNVKMEEKDVWVMGINLNPPVEMNEIELKSAEIFITRDSGELRSHTLMSEEL